MAGPAKAGGGVVVAGCEVVVQYSLALEDGTVVDQGDGDTSLCFTVGDGSLETGLEQVIIGLAVGERREAHLAPGQAFGEPEPENVHAMPREDFAHMNLEPGAVVGFTAPSGDEVAGTVMELDDDTVYIDFNHPLAGRRLQFAVEVMSIHPPVSD